MLLGEYLQILEDINRGEYRSFLALSKEDQKKWLDLKEEHNPNPIKYYRGGINYYR